MTDTSFDLQWRPNTGFSVGGVESPQPEAAQEQPASERPAREEPFDGPLTQSDLLDYENSNRIRDYMVRRYGTQYNDADPEQLVDDFVEHMRWFNTNTVSTAGEVRFISNGSEEDRQAAAQAYELYDSLGSVFANDGFFGAVEGIGDYVFAAATDPTNYIGLLTGGTARVAAGGVTAAGRQAIQAATRQAGLRAIRGGATQAAADRAASTAAAQAATRMLQRGVPQQARRQAASRIGRAERDIFLRRIAGESEMAFMAGRRQTAARASLYGTTALDGTFAALQEHQIQNVMMEVGVQEEYSRTQTAFGALFGLVGGGFQLLGRQAAGISGLEETGQLVELGTMRAAQQAIEDTALTRTNVTTLANAVSKGIDSWQNKVARGRQDFDPDVTPVDLLHEIVFGPGGPGSGEGVAGILQSLGVRLPRNMTVSDLMTDFVAQLPDSTLRDINTKLNRATGINIGDLTSMRTRLQDLLAKDINQSARTLNVMSQLRKTLDGGVVHGSNVMQGINASQAAQRAAQAEQKRMRLAGYGQSVWRRLLVSSPATTMANISGFGQYYVGQSVADLFNSGTLGMLSVATRPFSARRADELLRMGRVYRQIQAQKMRNFLDPYTTHDAYMAILEENKDARRALLETFTGGVERQADRFNIDPEAAWFKVTEAVTEGANRLTGVRIQDTFTKSQMFMTELDKNMRLIHDRDLLDVLESGDLRLIDDNVMGATLDTTMKSVFSKDYTGDDQLLGQVARFIESFSNIPVIGTVLPFGRFLNNTVAFAYQWSPAGLATPIGAVYRSMRGTGELAQKGNQVALLESTARAIVGTSALGAAMVYDRERQEQGLAWNEVQGAGGSIIDARNTFPFSAFLISGRVANLVSQGETVGPELITELGTQIGVGQFASDVQFGNDLINITDSILNFNEGDRRSTFDAVFRAAGNITAGFTRPLDAVNRLVGYIDDTDAARDLRQASGTQLFSQASTRYVDNIFERLFGRVEAVTGEELRVATRQGDVVDPNPLARIFGLTIRPARTETEQAYSMANMAEWTASERTSVPEYDRIFNTLIAPHLEARMERLTRDRRFVEGNSDERRVMLRETLRAARSMVRQYMQDYSTDPESRLAAMRRRANTMGNEALRNIAMQSLRDRGVDAGISDMTIPELQDFMDLVDYLQDTYRRGLD
jgi:hypothetical protein